MLHQISLAEIAAITQRDGDENRSFYNKASIRLQQCVHSFLEKVIADQ